MPKLKETDQQKKDRLLRANVDYYISYYGRTYQELADYLGISKKALMYKLKNPNKFWVSELRTLFEYLHFTDEQKSEVA